MFKNKIIIICTMFIALLSFSYSTGIITESDEFDNVTYFKIGIASDLNNDDEYLIISLLGINRKLNAKCWTSDLANITLYSDYIYDIKNLDMSIDGKVYNDVLNNKNLEIALKKVKPNSKIRFRLVDEYDTRSTFEIEKKHSKDIYDFFNKKCK